MWAVPGIQVYGDWLNPEPVRVLYEFDGPRIFICEDDRCRSYLAFKCGEGEGLWRFLVVPFSQYHETSLTSGQISLRDALINANAAWIFDIDADFKAVRVWEVKIDQLPQNVIPAPGVMIYRHLPKRYNNSFSRSSTSVKTIVVSLPGQATENYLQCKGNYYA